MFHFRLDSFSAFVLSPAREFLMIVVKIAPPEYSFLEISLRFRSFLDFAAKPSILNSKLSILNSSSSLPFE